MKKHQSNSSARSTGSPSSASNSSVDPEDYDRILPAWVSPPGPISEAYGNLVRANIVDLANNRAVNFGMIFYERLFDVAPSVKLLFKSPTPRQAKMLTSFLCSSMELLRNEEQLASSLRNIASRHVRYGARVHHYFVVADVLLWSLENATGRRWTAAHAVAWTAVYSQMLHIMIPEALRGEQALEADEDADEQERHTRAVTGGAGAQKAA